MMLFQQWESSWSRDPQSTTRAPMATVWYYCEFCPSHKPLLLCSPHVTKQPMPRNWLNQHEYALLRVVQAYGYVLYKLAKHHWTNTYGVVYHFCELQNIAYLVVTHLNTGVLWSEYFTPECLFNREVYCSSRLKAGIGIGLIWRLFQGRGKWLSVRKRWHEKEGNRYVVELNFINVVLCIGIPHRHRHWSYYYCVRQYEAAIKIPLSSLLLYSFFRRRSCTIDIPFDCSTSILQPSSCPDNCRNGTLQERIIPFCMQIEKVIFIGDSSNFDTSLWWFSETHFAGISYSSKNSPTIIPSSWLIEILLSRLNSSSSIGHIIWLVSLWNIDTTYASMNCRAIGSTRPPGAR